MGRKPSCPALRLGPLWLGGPIAYSQASLLAGARHMLHSLLHVLAVQKYYNGLVSPEAPSWLLISPEDELRWALL